MIHEYRTPTENELYKSLMEYEMDMNFTDGKLHDFAKERYNIVKNTIKTKYSLTEEQLQYKIKKFMENLEGLDTETDDMYGDLVKEEDGTWSKIVNLDEIRDIQMKAFEKYLKYKQKYLTLKKNL